MTLQEQEEAKKVVRLSILIPVTPERYTMLNDLYYELKRQVEQGYLGKGLETWKTNIVSETDQGSKVIGTKNHSFKHPDLVEIILDKSNETIGAKRNNLLNKALGKYVCFIDSDDMVSSDYVKSIMQALEFEPDCVSLRGEMTTNGKNPELFEHSLKYSSWKTTNNKIKYERYPNHLNVIKSSIAKRFKFPEKNFGEDHVWSTVVHNSRLLKKEIYLDQVLYYYRYNTKVLA